MNAYLLLSKTLAAVTPLRLFLNVALVSPAFVNRLEFVTALSQDVLRMFRLSFLRLQVVVSSFLTVRERVQ